jgi:hypothetical protein
VNTTLKEQRVPITANRLLKILWSAPAERSGGDGAFIFNSLPKRRRRSALPAHSIECRHFGREARIQF